MAVDGCVGCSAGCAAGGDCGLVHSPPVAWTTPKSDPQAMIRHVAHLLCGMNVPPWVGSRPCWMT